MSTKKLLVILCALVLALPAPSFAADTKITDLTAASAAAGANELPINEAGADKKITVTQIATYLQTIGMPVVVALSSDATANSTTTGVEITGLRVTGLGVGTYVFRYWIRYQSAATTTGVKFGVNHTGTAAMFMANMRYASTGGTAATGAATQAAASATGNIHESFSTRTKSTTAPNLGPTISVDTANADMLVAVEGLIRVTVSGDLAFWHASEVAASSTVMAESSLILTRTR
jgi:hypothetical protein